MFSICQSLLLDLLLVFLIISHLAKKINETG
nr:MAG TPA: hypothetical protein [Caudoviricetes sp.]